MAKVLIVDDEPELLQALTVRLSASGYACVTARNGVEGLAKAREEHPDLIVADLLMPEMDGYEMIRQLKAEPDTAKIPVIVLTAMPGKRADSLPAARVLPKPFNSKILLETMRELIGAGTSGGPHG